MLHRCLRPDYAAMHHDAVTLLRDDHRDLQQSFERFQAARSLWAEEQAALDIVNGMRVHSDIDRNVFYPALGAGSGAYVVRKCLDDHTHIDSLLDEIERAGPTEDAFFAKIHVLCALFQQHVQDEEKPRGVFEQAQHAPLDLTQLAGELQRRKALLSIPLAPA